MSTSETPTHTMQPHGDELGTAGAAVDDAAASEELSSWWEGSQPMSRRSSEATIGESGWIAKKLYVMENGEGAPGTQMGTIDEAWMAEMEAARAAEAEVEAAKAARSHEMVAQMHVAAAEEEALRQPLLAVRVGVPEVPPPGRE